MGCILGSDNQELIPEKMPNRTADERERCIITLKLQRDKIARRILDLEKQIKLAENKARELAREKKKEQAIYYLAKKRMMTKNYQKFNQRLLLVETRGREMESVMDDIQFTKMLDESNDQMKELLEEVNYNAIEEANELSREVDFNNQQVLDMITENNADEDILNEFNNLGEQESHIEEKDDPHHVKVKEHEHQHEEPEMMMA